MTIISSESPLTVCIAQRNGVFSNFHTVLENRLLNNGHYQEHLLTVCIAQRNGLLSMFDIVL